MDRYGAELDKAPGPLRGRLQSTGECPSAAACAEAGALGQKFDVEYETVSSRWWGTSGPFHAGLARHREPLLEDRIPCTDALENFEVVSYGFFGVPADSFRSTAALQAVPHWMKTAQAVLGGRADAPME